MEAQKLEEALGEKLTTSLTRDALKSLANELDVADLDDDWSEVNDVQDIYTQRPSKEALEQAEATIKAYAERMADRVINSLNLHCSDATIEADLHAELESQLKDTPFDLRNTEHMAKEVSKSCMKEMEKTIEVSKSMDVGQTNLFELYCFEEEVLSL